MSFTPPFASQSQSFLSDNAPPNFNNSSSQTHATMGHVALLIRCQCGAVTPSWLSHAAHCSSTTLPPHCIAMAASILAGSDIRDGAASSIEQSNGQAGFCRDFAALHPQMTAADGSPLLTEHTPLVDVLRVACYSPCKFFGQHKTTPLDSRGRQRVTAGQIKCYLRAADSNKHSHAMRDAFALINQWAKEQPGMKTLEPAAAGESALGGLRVLCAAGFPSTLLQHVVRFGLERLRSFTVEWCRGLHTQRRAAGARLIDVPLQDRRGAIDERGLCFWLAYLLQHEATVNMQHGELEELVQMLHRDGIFVQPHSSRNNDLRRFLIDTLNLNRTMDFLRNLNQFPQLFPHLFPSAPSTPTSSSDASVEQPPALTPSSPSNSSTSSASSGASLATAPSRELASPFRPHDEVCSNDDSDDGPASKRRRVDLPELFSDQLDKHAERAYLHCWDLSNDNGAAPLAPSPPLLCPPQTPRSSARTSLPAEPLSFPEISPSTP